MLYKEFPVVAVLDSDCMFACVIFPVVKVLLESFHLYGSFKAAAMLSAASQTLRGTDLALDARSSFLPSFNMYMYR